MTARRPRLVAADAPEAGGLEAIRIEAEDEASALAELAWAIERGAQTVIVPDLEAARDYLIVHDALEGRTELDPGLALDPALRREPTDAA